MSTSVLTTHAPYVAPLVVRAGAPDPYGDGEPHTDVVLYLTDGGDAPGVTADNPADILAVLDAARATLLAQYPHLDTTNTKG